MSDRVGELDLSDCSDFTKSQAADITIFIFIYFFTIDLKIMQDKLCTAYDF